MDLDHEGKHKSMLWNDKRSRDLYPSFCDVISFDTTYIINKYIMSFASFVRLNHHNSSILLITSFLADEKIKTYVWLFNTWLNCMDGLAPKSIITYQFNQFVML